MAVSQIAVCHWCLVRAPGLRVSKYTRARDKITGRTANAGHLPAPGRLSPVRSVLSSTSETSLCR